MKEIVFEESTAWSLENSGISKNEILIFPNDMYYGRIAKDEDLDTHWLDDVHKSSRARFEEAINTKDSFRIWYSTTIVSDYSGFYYTCSLLDKYSETVYGLNVADYESVWSSWAALPSKVVSKYIGVKKILEKGKIQSIASNWNQLRRENIVFRELNFNNYLLVSSYKSQIDGLISYERSALIAMDKTFRSASNIIGYIMKDWGFISPEVAYSILISLAAQNEPLIEFNVSSPEKLSFRETECRLTDKGSVLSDAIKQCMKVKNWERKDVSDRG